MYKYLNRKKKKKIGCFQMHVMVLTVRTWGTVRPSTGNARVRTTWSLTGTGLVLVSME